MINMCISRGLLREIVALLHGYEQDKKFTEEIIAIHTIKELQIFHKSSPRSSSPSGHPFKCLSPTAGLQACASPVVYTSTFVCLLSYLCLRCCGTNREVAGSIPAGVIGNFH